MPVLQLQAAIQGSNSCGRCHILIGHIRRKRGAVCPAIGSPTDLMHQSHTLLDNEDFQENVIANSN